MARFGSIHLPRGCMTNTCEKESPLPVYDPKVKASELSGSRETLWLDKWGYADKTCACTGYPSLPMTRNVSTTLTLGLVASVNRSLGTARVVRTTLREPRDWSLRLELVQEELPHSDSSRLKSDPNSSQDA
ncbi:hypothetical protein CRG98_040605 [Punica granatum]|uniref:Uncharacterized protein n=1 Tax=Punica granatum TaxID=22663 RepID=A0A2I0I4X3_PUNGR|nr:hypothetical protein CRG98_040605 [Punica granatum]